MTDDFCLAVALCMLTVGFLGGVAAERIRFYRRHLATLRRTDELIRRWHGFLAMRIDEAAAGSQLKKEAGPASPLPGDL